MGKITPGFVPEPRAATQGRAASGDFASREPARRASLSRRSLLGLAAGLPLVACSAEAGPEGETSASGGTAGRGGTGGAAAGGGSGGGVAGAAGGGEDAGACELPADCVVTEDNIEGPFYKAGAPLSPGATANLRSGVTGAALQVRGVIYAADCITPLRGALVDVWQADDAGEYDNTGFTLRARMRTDACGRYQFDSVLPGNYDDRPRHIHYKVSHPDGRSLTTQLYFAGEMFNDTDPFVKESLVKPLTELDTPTGRIRSCRFDIVLA